MRFYWLNIWLIFEVWISVIKKQFLLNWLSKPNMVKFWTFAKHKLTIFKYVSSKPHFQQTNQKDISFGNFPLPKKETFHHHCFFMYEKRSSTKWGFEVELEQVGLLLEGRPKAMHVLRQIKFWWLPNLIFTIAIISLFSVCWDMILFQTIA